MPVRRTDAARNRTSLGPAVAVPTAALAGQTVGVIAPAADHVSIAMSNVLGSFGRDFQVVTGHAAALLHDKFMSLLNDAVTTDSSAEATIGACNDARPQGLRIRDQGSPANLIPRKILHKPNRCADKNGRPCTEDASSIQPIDRRR